MGTYITRYKTENGKTHKTDEPAVKPADEKGAPEDSGADNKNQPAAPAKQGA